MVGVQVEAPAGQVAVTADQVAQEVTAVGAGQVAQKVTAVVLGRDLTAVALEEPRPTVTSLPDMALSLEPVSREELGNMAALVSPRRLWVLV